jgi:rubredoxin
MVNDPRQIREADKWWNDAGKDFVCPACGAPGPWPKKDNHKIPTEHPFGTVFLTLTCKCNYTIFVRSPIQT